MTSSRTKAVVVFSGGQDSTTCLYWAKRQFDVVYALSFHYGQRHAIELDYATTLAKEANVPHHIVDLSFIATLSPNALTSANVPIDASEDVPNTFVPGRNHLFFSVAATFAYSVGADHIVTGVSETDFSGYPDCRASFIQSLQQTVNLAMDANFTFHTPLMQMTKRDVWALADELGVFDLVKEQTVTCYEGIPAAGCKVCPACQLRNEGLRLYERERPSSS